MDTNFATQLTLSILTLAPGVALLAGLAFVGLLMLIEKTVLRSQAVSLVVPAHSVQAPAAQNPGPGRIVAELRAAVQDQEAQQRVVGARK